MALKDWINRNTVFNKDRSMKVRMLRNPAAKLECDLKEGETGNVSKELGEKLIKLGIAVEASKETDEPETIHAVPPEPEIAHAKTEGFADNPHKKPEKK